MNPEANTRPYHLPSDAVWLITGCSSGIGHGLAQFIAKTSNRVVATARNPSSLSGIPDSGNVLKVQLDVTSLPSIDAAFETALATFQRIDVVVNNAGYTLVGDTEGAGDEEARALMDTNFWGMVDVSKKALGVMRDINPKTGQQGGVILNISSMGGWFGFPACSFYHASKFAMEGWTEAVAKELPVDWNIHLSNIEPGGVKTKYVGTSLKEMERRHPAYSDPSYPTNVLYAYMRDPKSGETWAEPQAIAATMWKLVSRGERIPIRVPLGPDSWSMIMADLDAVKKDLEGLKELSESVGNPEHADVLKESIGK